MEEIRTANSLHTAITVVSSLVHLTAIREDSLMEGPGDQGDQEGQEDQEDQEVDTINMGGMVNREATIDHNSKGFMSHLNNVSSSNNRQPNRSNLNPHETLLLHNQHNLL